MAHCQCALLDQYVAVGKARDKHAVRTSLNGASNMVKMQMRQEHVCDVLA